MKTLILLRHAKAERGEPDHERSLDPRGLGDAVRAAEAIRAARLRPDAALVSDARRTIETYREVAGVLGPIQHEVVEPALYEASAATILARIRATPEPVGCLLVIGHNPGLAELARLLAAKGPGQAMAELRRRFPTATAAVIDLPASRWSAIGTDGTLRSLFLVDPDPQGG